MIFFLNFPPIMSFTMKIKDQHISWNLVTWRKMKLKGRVILKRFKTLRKFPCQKSLYQQLKKRDLTLL
jgi:hypothetical protein